MAREGLKIAFGDDVAEGVVGEGRRAGGVDNLGLSAHCIVGISDGWRVVRIIGGEELSPAVVSVGGYNAAGVGAGGKAAVVGVGVGQSFAVGVGLGEEKAGGFIVRPRGGVAHAGDLVAIGGH